MSGRERREKLVNILKMRTEPVSGTELARSLGVSRQIIVQDIALARAENYEILSTTKGYILYEPKSRKLSRNFCVKHTTEQIGDELMTIVIHGGNIRNVVVCHPIYGKIATDLIISTARDVEEFVKKVQAGNKPLKELTDDVHYHLVEAESEEILNEIEEALKEKNYLIPDR